MKVNVSKLLKYILFFPIYLFFALQVSFFPNDWFYDRTNYVNFAKYSSDILNSYNSYYFNEPLFLFFNTILTKFVNYNLVPQVFCFLCVFFVCFYILYFSKNILFNILGFLLILSCSFSSGAMVGSLRQTLATCILIFSVILLKDIRKIVIVSIVLGFFHSSFFLISLLMIAFLCFSKIKSQKISFLLLSFLSFGISLISLAVMKYLGVRQYDDYAGVSNSVGGGGFLIFLTILLYFIFFPKEKSSNIYIYSMVGMISYLSMYFFSFISGRLMFTFFYFIVFTLISWGRRIDFYFIVYLIVVLGYASSLNLSFSLGLELPIDYILSNIDNYLIYKGIL